jgi:hypothetical protein
MNIFAHLLNYEFQSTLNGPNIMTLPTADILGFQLKLQDQMLDDSFTLAKYIGALNELL